MKSKSRIHNILSCVKKPSAVEAAALSKCFPSSNKCHKKFDPTEESVVKHNQEKKKRGIKHSKVEVILLKDFQRDIPKGEARKKLRRRGQICDVLLNKTMTPLQVENCIKNAFKHFSLSSFVVLDTDSTGHFLTRAATQQIDGAKAISRRGCSIFV